MTQVVNLRKEPYDVYIGRGSPWGNPYSHLPFAKGTSRVGSRSEAIAAYAKWMLEKEATRPGFFEELRGKTLGCYCKPLDCHGDLIVTWLDD